MNSILDWAISFLGESTQGTIRAIYFEGKTVKQHSEEEYVDGELRTRASGVCHWLSSRFRAISNPPMVCR